MSGKYRRIAESFQTDSGNLKCLFKDLQAALGEIPDEHAEAVEEALVERIENALRDVFGLECDIESAYSEADEDEEDAHATL